MARPQQGLPTVDFVNDPLPPGGKRPRGLEDLRPREFQPAATVQLGDAQFTITQRVDGSTPWRKTGNTDFDSFLAAISRTHPPAEQSPLVGEARALYDILHAAGLTRFAAAMLWHEKKNDTWRDTPIPAWMHNPFSTKDRARPGEWEQHATYADAARAWVERVSKHPYPQDGSILDFVNIYAPAIENSVPRYVAVLTEEINALPLEDALPAPPKGKPVTIPGLPRPIFVPTDLVVEVQLVPPDHLNNRPGLPMTPKTYTQHDTGNPRVGMGADAHSRWLDTGAPGAADNQVGVHLFVDDKKVIIKTPFNEVQWHAGDGDGPGNMSSISCELCVNADRDVARAERNAAVFAAAVIRDGLQRGIEALVPHQNWSGKDCPHSLLPRWGEFRDIVGRLLAEGGIPAPIFPGLPPTMPAEVLLALFPEANPDGPVTKFYIDYCVNHMPPGQWPRFNGAQDLSDGTRWWDFNPLHIFSNSEGKVWVAGTPDSADPAAQKTSTTGAQLPRLESMMPGPPVSELPARDFAIKEQAIERDRKRRKGVVKTETKLRDEPRARAEVLRTLPAGTEVTILDRSENDFLPVVVREGRQERGYVRENAVDILGDESGRGDRPDASGKPKAPGKAKPPGKPKAPGKPKGAGGTGGTEAPATDGDQGQRIAAEASRYVGFPYVWATHGPNSFDCSGLVHWVILQATGQSVSPDSHAQFNMGDPVDWDRLRPGDILFYDTMKGQEVREGNRASHVGIFVRNGLMVNALNEDRGVIESDPFSDYFKPRYLGARRIP